MTELNTISALFIGFLGSTHCLGMCSGLACATGQGEGGVSRIAAYNLGRLLSYALLGAIAGLLGGQIVQVAPQFTIGLRVIAGLLLVAMGLYISRWWMGLARLERIGEKLWRYLQPFSRSLLPVTSNSKALVMGGIWGLLPCGLVYSTLSWALAAADWRQSAAFMLAFGVGTLPAMLGVGLFSQSLAKILRTQGFRAGAGVLVMLMGVWTIIQPLQHVLQGQAKTPHGNMRHEGMHHDQDLHQDH